MEKTYIGKVEAYEVMLERNIPELPRKGKEWLTVRCVAENKPDLVLGKDEKGFYLAEYVCTSTQR